MEWFIRLDQEILLRVNKDFTNTFFDWFFPNITDLHKTWGFRYVFMPLLLGFLFYWNRVRGVVFFLSLMITLAINDAVGGKFLKPFFERARPSVAGVDVFLRAPHFGGFSFPSNHAMNMFCMTAFVSSIYPKTRWLLLVWALLVAYSRVYVGVHYPSDVIGGAILGSLVGLGCSKVYIYLAEYFSKRGQQNV